MKNSPSKQASFVARAALWLCAAGIALLFVTANWHLVYVAFASQPECVTHVRHGAGNAERGQFAAAKSGCTPMERASP